MLKQLDLFSLNQNPIKKISEKEFLKAGSVVLGHLTSDRFLNDILSKGLLAQSETNIESVGGHTNIDDHEYVYLARIPDTFFSQQSVKKFRGNEILIVVDIPVNKLETDPFGDLTASKNISDILHVINNTNRNLRVHKKIEPELILGIYNISELRSMNLISNTSLNSIPYLSIYKNLNNIMI